MRAVGHQVDVVQLLVLGAVRLVADLEAAQVLDPATRPARPAPRGAAGSRSRGAASRRSCPRRRSRRRARARSRSCASSTSRRRPRPARSAPCLQVGAAVRSSRVDSRTPVNSQHDSMPCVYCTLGTATLPHSIAVFAPHSMKWMRETDGSRIRSSIVKTRGLAHQPVDHQPVLRRIDVPPALVVALEVQAARRDDPEQRTAAGRTTPTACATCVRPGLWRRWMLRFVGRRRAVAGRAATGWPRPVRVRRQVRGSPDRRRRTDSRLALPLRRRGRAAALRIRQPGAPRHRHRTRARGP